MTDQLWSVLVIFISCLGYLHAQESDEFCDPPDEVSHAELTDPKWITAKKFPHRFRVTYRCVDGRIMTGSDTRTCWNGTWSKPEFTCTLIKCRDIDHPENGRRLDNNNKPRTTTRFECNEGFRMIGSSTMDCRGDGTWREESPPICEIIKCRDIDHPENGRRLDSNNKLRTTTRFECDEGYRMIGSSTMDCRGDGTWREESPPICEIIKCRDIDQPENGRRLDSNNKPRTTTRFECNEGYKIIGSDTMFCREDGTWREDSPPICKIVCGPPANVEHAELADQKWKTKSDFTDGDTVTYRCEEGRRMDGLGKITCKDGRWSEPTFTCDWRLCDFIDHPENGKRLDWNNEPATTTRFECNKGYTLVGSKTMNCRVGGTWRPSSPPTCRVVMCPEPREIEHGSIFQPSLDGIYNDYGSEVTYSCDGSRKLQGLSVRRCLEDGTWEGEEPTCIVSTCPPLNNFENGEVEYFQTPIETDTMAFISCRDRADLEPSDADTIICLVTEKWNVVPRCLSQVLLKEDTQKYGPLSISYQTGRYYTRARRPIWVRHGIKVRFYCRGRYEFYRDDRYEVTQFLYSTNYNGVLKPDVPVCKGKRCRVQNVANGKNTDENGTTAEGLVEHGTVIETKCDNKYQIKYGKKSINKCDKGSLDSPECEGESCPLPATPDHTSYDYSKRNVKTGHVRHGQKVRVKCRSRKYFELVYDEGNYPGKVVIDIECQFGEFQGEFPHCEEKRCSLANIRSGYEQLSCQSTDKQVTRNMIQSGVSIVAKCKENHQFIGDPNRQQVIITCNKGDLEDIIKCEAVPCDIPEVINGEVKDARYRIEHGKKKTVTCNEGFDLSNEQTETSVLCNYGTIRKDVALICIEKKCLVRDIAGVENMEINDQDINKGKVESRSTVEPECKEGYEQSHQVKSTMFCSKGEWKGTFKCNAKKCPTPDISNGRIQNSDDEATIDHDKMVVAFCDEGYTFKDSSSRLTTQCKFGKFVPPVSFNCLEKKCLTTVNPNYHYFHMNGAKVKGVYADSGLQIKAKCDEGYTFKNEVDLLSLNISCLKGKWLDTIPCEPKKCPLKSINGIERMHAVPFDDNEEKEMIESGKSVFITCKDGYQLEDDTKDIFKCNLGDWLGAVRCLPKNCSVDGLKNASELIITTDNRPIVGDDVESGSTFKAKCSKGFKLLKRDEIKVTCEKGNWTGVINCEQVPCPEPEVDNARIIKALDQYEHDSVVDVVCEEGFEFQKDENRRSSQCKLGEFEPYPVFKCNEKKCLVDDLGELNYTIVKDKSGLELNENDRVDSGNTVEVECEDGYEITEEENGSPACYRGTWNIFIKCVEKTCVVPAVAEATIFTFPRLQETEAGMAIENDSSIYIQCQAGFSLDGPLGGGVSTQLTCELGLWSSTIPTECRSNEVSLDETGKCKVDIPDNAEVSVNNKPLTLAFVNEGDLLDLKCHRGYKIMFKGQKIPIFRTNCKNTQLTRSMPICERRKAEKKIDCKLPNNEKISVTPKNKVDDGYVSHKNKVTLKCPYWEKDLESHCIDGKWDPVIQKCEKEPVKLSSECTLPDDLFKFDGGLLSPGEKVQHGTVVGIDCIQDTLDYNDFYSDYYDGDNVNGTGNNILCEEGHLVNYERIKSKLYCDEVLDDSCKTIKNGDISTTYGDIEVTCDTGYTSNTPKYVEIMCDDGKLKTKYGKHVKCVPDGCQLPDYLGYLQVTDYKNYKRGSMLSGSMELNHNHRILVYCYHNNHEPNNRILKCVKGEWKVDDKETWKMDENTTFPECREAICEPKCQNSGTCVRDNKCKCLKENFGAHCEKFKCEEECVRNGGSCPNSNACVCPKYKSGKNCENDVCDPLCENSGTCLADNKCQCTENTYGNRCEKFHCSDECVANGGSCPTSNDCVCPKEKLGENCEIDVCKPECRNSGKCVKGNKCVCTDKTHGYRCEKFHCSDECVVNGGSCPTSNDCVCPKEKFGENCEIDVCKPECKNSGKCVKGNKCECTDKTDGYRCEKFDCAKECTDNGGSCPNSNDCECPNGRFGSVCQFIKCRQPDTNAKLPRNQMVYNKGQIIEGMTCETGFKLSGNTTLICLGDGTWSGTVSCVENKRVKYRIRVTTGRGWASGTNGDVYITMYGEYGETEKTELTRDMDGRGNKFRPETSDSFELYLHDVGQISKIEISLQLGLGWVLHRISIYDYSRQQYYYFYFNIWIYHGFPKVWRAYGSTRCGAEFSNPVTMNAPYKIDQGRTRDVVECQMLCVEYTSSHCFGVVFREASENCYILRSGEYNIMSPATSKTRNNETYYNRINC